MKLSLLFFSVFTLCGSAISFSQTSASASFSASVTIVEPIGITTTSDMNFARVEAGEGGLVILAPDDSRIAQGGIQLAEGETGTAASFEVIGTEGFAYDLSLPKGSFFLSNGTEEIVIKDFKSDIEGSGNLSGGSQVVKVGATLEVNPNQTPGNYSNSNGFTVTVNYN